MKTDLWLLPLQADSADYAEAEALYVDAFPPEERRNVKDWKNLMAHDGGAFRALRIAGPERGFLGFLTYWNLGKFYYVEHFAVSASARGGGIGGKALDLLLATTKDMPLVLEVEPPVTDDARRRIAFYERHRLMLSPLPYWQPPYDPSKTKGLELNLMTTDLDFLNAHADEVRQTLYREIYHATFQDSADNGNK